MPAHLQGAPLNLAALSRNLGLDGRTKARYLDFLADLYLLIPLYVVSFPMTVVDHLTLPQLQQRIKKAKDPVEKTRLLAVYHAKRGLTAQEVAAITLQDRRHHNPGPRPKLTPEEQERVLQALQGTLPDGGLWTGLKLQRWVAEVLGKEVSLTPSTASCTRWAIPSGRSAVPGLREQRVRLLAYDEHRLGLRPVYRRMWARRWGASPPVVLRGTFGEPETGSL